MENFILELLKVGAWVFGIIFVFAIIGVVAIIGWIIGLFRKTEQAVESGVQAVEGQFHRHDG